MDKNVELLEYIYQDADMGVKSLTNLINAINNKDNKIKKLVEEKLKGYEEILKKSKKLLKDYQAEPKSKGLKADLGSLMGIKMELGEADANNTYIIWSLSCNNHDDALRISALEFSPGSKVKLLQSSPYKICMIGSGRVAISDNMADMINVEK